MAELQCSTFRASRCLPVDLVLSFPTVKPADEEERSEEAEVAGIARCLTDKAEGVGKYLPIKLFSNLITPLKLSIKIRISQKFKSKDSKFYFVQS